MFSGRHRLTATVNLKNDTAMPSFSFEVTNCFKIAAAGITDDNQTLGFKVGIACISFRFNQLYKRCRPAHVVQCIP